METKPNTPRHSILILTYNKPDLIHARVQEILRLYGSRKDVELFIFDNGSTDAEHALALLEIKNLILTESPEGISATIARTEENLAFGQGFNEAVASTYGQEIIHLLSNDVRVYGDFIAPVDRVLSDDEALVGQNMVNGKSGWNEFGNDPPIPYLSGHYLAMRRDTWEDIGGFDPLFNPYDYEDMDLSLTATRRGYPVVAITGLPLTHLVAGTIGYTPERFEHTVKMRALFAEKWGLDNTPERP